MVIRTVKTMDNKGNEYSLYNAFERVIQTKLAGVMLHTDLMNFCHLQGLQGLKRWHRFNIREDLEGKIKIDNYLVDNFCYSNPNIEFEIWHKYPESLKEQFDIWIDFENKVINELTEIICWLEQNKCFMEVKLINKLLCKAKKELKEILRLKYRIEQYNYDSLGIQLLSDSIHKEYQEKENKKQGRKIK